jgi:membrane-bound lytic murein transglycosylase D
MKLARSLLVVFLLGAIGAKAQEAVDPTALIQDADQWLAENIDDSVLDALGIDRDRTREFLVEVQKQFQGEYVLDLAALRETAVQLVPVLDKFEETEPYALWLKSHLDYFDAADRLKQQSPTNAPTLKTKPTPQMERKVWVELMERRADARQSPLVGRLKSVFREEGAPSELVWLAEVESSFNPKARSPVGAAGLFQLMPVTARSLDLSVGLLRDERMNEEKSARAAARYLKRLRERFGDWRLALAAYNCGESRVAELLRRKNARSFDAIAPSLPAETQMYVPKVEALIRKREGRSLTSLPAGAS